MINHQKPPIITCKNLKVINNLTKSLMIIKMCITIRTLIMIHSLTSKTRFFKLFIENKNLIKQGLYLLEICQNAAGSTDLATDLRGHDGLPWTPSSHTCAISSAALFIPSTASMMDRHKHDGPSRVSVPKYFNSWNRGT